MACFKQALWFFCLINAVGRLVFVKGDCELKRCSGYDPVCGSNLVSYVNPCQLEIISCHSNGFISFLYKGPCKGNTINYDLPFTDLFKVMKISEGTGFNESTAKIQTMALNISSANFNRMFKIPDETAKYLANIRLRDVLWCYGLNKTSTLMQMYHSMTWLNNNRNVIVPQLQTLIANNLLNESYILTNYPHDVCQKYFPLTRKLMSSPTSMYYYAGLLGLTYGDFNIAMSKAGFKEILKVFIDGHFYRLMRDVISLEENMFHKKVAIKKFLIQLSGNVLINKTSMGTSEILNMTLIDVIAKIHNIDESTVTAILKKIVFESDPLSFMYFQDLLESVRKDFNLSTHVISAINFFNLAESIRQKERHALMQAKIPFIFAAFNSGNNDLSNMETKKLMQVSEELTGVNEKFLQRIFDISDNQLLVIKNTPMKHFDVQKTRTMFFSLMQLTEIQDYTEQEKTEALRVGVNFSRTHPNLTYLIKVLNVSEVSFLPMKFITFYSNYFHMTSVEIHKTFYDGTTTFEEVFKRFTNYTFSDVKHLEVQFWNKTLFEVEQAVFKKIKDEIIPNPTPRPGDCSLDPMCVRFPFQPVCGSDLQTYQHPCYFEYINCLSGNLLKILHQGPCKGLPNYLISLKELTKKLQMTEDDFYNQFMMDIYTTALNLTEKDIMDLIDINTTLSLYLKTSTFRDVSWCFSFSCDVLNDNHSSLMSLMYRIKYANGLFPNLRFQLILRQSNITIPSLSGPMHKICPVVLNRTDIALKKHAMLDMNVKKQFGFNATVLQHILQVFGIENLYLEYFFRNKIDDKCSLSHIQTQIFRKRSALLLNTSSVMITTQSSQDILKLTPLVVIQKVHNLAKDTLKSFMSWELISFDKIISIYFQNYTLANLAKELMISNDTMLNLSMNELTLLLNKKVNRVWKQLKVPVILLAFHLGIDVNTMKNYTLFDLALKSINTSEDFLVNVMQVNRSVLDFMKKPIQEIFKVRNDVTLTRMKMLSIEVLSVIASAPMLDIMQQYERTVSMLRDRLRYHQLLKVLGVNKDVAANATIMHFYEKFLGLSSNELKNLLQKETHVDNVKFQVYILQRYNDLQRYSDTYNQTLSQLDLMMLNNVVPPTEPRPACDFKKRICTNDWLPVCGSDSKTYENECFLEKQRCLSDEKLHMQSTGVCLPGRVNLNITVGPTIPLSLTLDQILLMKNIDPDIVYGVFHMDEDAVKYVKSAPFNKVAQCFQFNVQVDTFKHMFNQIRTYFKSSKTESLINLRISMLRGLGFTTIGHYLPPQNHSLYESMQSFCEYLPTLYGFAYDPFLISLTAKSIPVSLDVLSKFYKKLDIEEQMKQFTLAYHRNDPIGYHIGYTGLNHTLTKIYGGINLSTIMSKTNHTREYLSMFTVSKLTSLNFNVPESLVINFYKWIMMKVNVINVLSTFPLKNISVALHDFTLVDKPLNYSLAAIRKFGQDSEMFAGLPLVITAYKNNMIGSNWLVNQTLMDISIHATGASELMFVNYNRMDLLTTYHMKNTTITSLHSNYHQFKDMTLQRIANLPLYVLSHIYGFQELNIDQALTKSFSYIVNVPISQLKSIFMITEDDFNSISVIQLLTKYVGFNHKDLANTFMPFTLLAFQKHSLHYVLRKTNTTKVNNLKLLDQALGNRCFNFCVDTWTPVCSKSNETFVNECHLRRKECELEEESWKLHDGVCDVFGEKFDSVLMSVLPKYAHLNVDSQNLFQIAKSIDVKLIKLVRQYHLSGELLAYLSNASLNDVSQCFPLTKSLHSLKYIFNTITWYSHHVSAYVSYIHNKFSSYGFTTIYQHFPPGNPIYSSAINFCKIIPHLYELSYNPYLMIKSASLLGSSTLSEYRKFLKNLNIESNAKDYTLAYYRNDVINRYLNGIKIQHKLLNFNKNITVKSIVKKFNKTEDEVMTFSIAKILKLYLEANDAVLYNIHKWAFMGEEMIRVVFGMTIKELVLGFKDPNLRNQSMFDIYEEIKNRGQQLAQFGEFPVIMAAFRNNISKDVITSHTLMDLTMKVSKLPEKFVIQWYNMATPSVEHMKDKTIGQFFSSSLQNSTVKRLLNIPIAILSTPGRLKSTDQTESAILLGVKVVNEKLKFSNFPQMYGMSQEDVQHIPIAGLYEKYVGVSANEFATMFSPLAVRIFSSKSPMQLLQQHNLRDSMVILEMNYYLGLDCSLHICKKEWNPVCVTSEQTTYSNLCQLKKSNCQHRITFDQTKIKDDVCTEHFNFSTMLDVGVHHRNLIELLKSNGVNPNFIIRNYLIGDQMLGFLRNTTMNDLHQCFTLPKGPMSVKKLFDTIRSVLENPKHQINQHIATLKSFGFDPESHLPSKEIYSTSIQKFCSYLPELYGKAYDPYILKSLSMSIGNVSSTSLKNFWNEMNVQVDMKELIVALHMKDMASLENSRNKLLSKVQAFYRKLNTSSFSFNMTLTEITAKKTNSSILLVTHLLQSINIGKNVERVISRMIYGGLINSFPGVHGPSLDIWDLIEIVKTRGEHHNKLVNSPIVYTAGLGSLFGLRSILHTNIMKLFLAPPIISSEEFLVHWYELSTDRVKFMRTATIGEYFHMTAHLGGVNPALLQHILTWQLSVPNYFASPMHLKHAYTEGVKAITKLVLFADLPKIYQISSGDVNILTIWKLFQKYQGLSETEQVQIYGRTAMDFFKKYTASEMVNMEFFNHTWQLNKLSVMLNQNFQQSKMDIFFHLQMLALPSFCGIDREDFNEMAFKDIAKRCVPMDIPYKPFKKLEKQSISELLELFQNSLLKRDIHYLSITQLATLYTSPVSIALLQPLHSLLSKAPVNVSDYGHIDLATLLLHNTFLKDEDSLKDVLTSWSGASDFMYLNMSVLANTMRRNLPDIFNLSLSNVILSSAVAAGGPGNYLPFDQAAPLCPFASTSSSLGLIRSCITDKNIHTMIDTQRMSGFSPSQLKVLLPNSYVVEKLSFPSMVIAGREATKHHIQKSEQSLLLLAYQHNINLKQLKENNLIITVTKIFKLPKAVVGNVFEIPEDILQQAESFSLQMLHSLDENIDNVKQVYTGSLRNLFDVVSSRRTGLDAITQELPKQVRLISSMNISQLQRIYEQSEEYFMSKTIVQLAMDLFGIDEKSFGDIFDTDVHKMMHLQSRLIKDVTWFFPLMQPNHDSLLQLSPSKIADIILNFASSGLQEFLLSSVDELKTQANHSDNSTMGYFIQNNIHNVSASEFQKFIHRYYDNIPYISAENFFTKLLTLNLSSLTTYNRTSNVFVLLKVAVKELQYNPFLHSKLSMWKDEDYQCWSKLCTIDEIFKMKSKDLSAEKQNLGIDNQFFPYIAGTTLERYRQLLGLTKDELKNQNMLDIFVHLSRVYKSLEEVLKGKHVIQLLADKGVSLAEASAMSVDSLLNITAGTQLNRLRNHPEFSGKYNDTFQQTFGMSTLGKLRQFKNVTGKKFRSQTSFLVLMKWVDLIEFYVNRLNVSILEQKHAQYVKMVREHQSIKTFFEWFNLQRNKEHVIAELSVKQLFYTKEDLSMQYPMNQFEADIFYKTTVGDLLWVDPAYDFYNGSIEQAERLIHRKEMTIFVSSIAENHYQSVGRDINVSKTLMELKKNVSGNSSLLDILSQYNNINRSKLRDIILLGLNVTSSRRSMFVELIQSKTLFTYGPSFKIEWKTVLEEKVIRVLWLLYSGIDSCRSTQGSPLDVCAEKDYHSVCSIGTYGRQCACQNGFLLRNTSSISLDIYCRDIDECLKNPCDALVNCKNTNGSFDCTECPEGYSGDGKSCEDLCSVKNCPKNSFCVNNIRDAECLCEDGYTFSNNQCVAGTVINKISGFKLFKPYNPKFADKKSKAFVNAAKEIEERVKSYFHSINQTDVIGVQVIKITEGSLIIDMNIIRDTANRSSTSSDDIKTSIVNGIRDGAFASLNADNNTIPSVQETNICELGTHNCMTNSQCITLNGGQFKCECISGYEFKDGQCVEEDEDNGNTLKIVLPIVIISLVAIFIIVIYWSRRNDKQNNGKPSAATSFQNDAYQSAY